VRFLDKEDGSAERGRGGTDESLSKVFVDVRFKDLEFVFGEVVDRAEDGLRTFFEWDVVVEVTAVRG
jgi:hypothetical protein